MSFEDLISRNLPKQEAMNMIPASMRSKMETDPRGWIPNSSRSAYFKKNYESMYHNLPNLKNQRFEANKSVLESIAENYLILKYNQGELKINENGVFVPNLNEAVNVTADITNYSFIQMPLLRKLYFANGFINLVGTQPARSRTGTFFKMDAIRPEDTDSSVFGRGAFNKTYMNYTENGTVNSLNMTLATDTFTTSERALSAEVSDMLQQDLSAEHGMDAFRELMPLVIDELTQMESVMLLDGLIAEAANFSDYVNWNRNGALVDDLKTTFGVKSYHQTLIDSIDTVARSVQKQVGVRPNWVIMDIDTFGIIEASLNTSFKDAYQNDNLRSLTGASIDLLSRDNKGLAYMGVLGGKYDVYVDNTGEASLVNKILVGSTSNTWLYQGMVYIPFVLGYAPSRLRSYDKIFNQKEGMLNRSGYKVVNPKFYGLVNITDS